MPKRKTNKTAAEVGNLLIAASDELKEVLVIARKLDGEMICDDSGITLKQARKLLEDFHNWINTSGVAHAKVLKSNKKPKYIM